MLVELLTICVGSLNMFIVEWRVIVSIGRCNPISFK